MSVTYAGAAFRGALPRAVGGVAANAVLRRCGAAPCPPGNCDHDDKLRRSPAGPGPTNVPRLVHDVLSTPGERLNASVRSYFEPRLGHDFGRVLVDIEPSAAESVRAVGAQAYTVGQHVESGAGVYAPGTAEGRRLIAHELTHTRQQRDATLRMAAALPVGAVDDSAEREADQVAAAVEGGGPYLPVPWGPGGQVATGPPPRPAPHGFGHDFSWVPIHIGVHQAPAAAPWLWALSGEKPCSPTWFGETSPEVDDKGRFTGQLIVKLNDAELKDPCVRACVQEHEQVHVERLTPIVKRIAACDREAGDHPEKAGRCNAMATRDLAAEHAPGECAAYRRSFTCLTLKLLDPASPCSKSPGKEEIQKHRGYEGCEMRNYCTSAGTRELGVPNA